jgi:hypothetical protein
MTRCFPYLLTLSSSFVRNHDDHLVTRCAKYGFLVVIFAFLSLTTSGQPQKEMNFLNPVERSRLCDLQEQRRKIMAQMENIQANDEVKIKLCLSASPEHDANKDPKL